MTTEYLNKLTAMEDTGKLDPENYFDPRLLGQPWAPNEDPSDDGVTTTLRKGYNWHHTGWSGIPISNLDVIGTKYIFDDFLSRIR